MVSIFDLMELLPGQKEKRTLLIQRFDEIEHVAHEAGNPIGAMLIDIDDFKWGINDAHGHQFGDQVLLEVAARLSTVARTDDVVVRFQSDEFVLLPAHLRSIEDLETRAMEILRLFDMPIIHDTITADVGVSIGMAMQEPGRQLWPLLAQAEEACWQAKRNGRGRASLYGSDWEAT